MTRTDNRCSAILALLLAGCVSACASRTGPSPALAPKAPPSTAELLRSATVNGIYDGHAVTLREGLYEGEPYAAGGASRPSVRLLETSTASGELDGAPGEEVTALLTESSGGSGERIYLAVFRLQDGTLANIATVLLGDRVKLRRLDIDTGTVVVDVVQAAPGEPQCCGTQLARKTYRLEGGRLKQTASQVVGRLSLAAIARVEWDLDEMNGKPLAASTQPPTFTIQGDTASGFAGCNRFSGFVHETGPGKISLGDLAATMMACDGPQMSIEDEFLRSLRLAKSYTFLAGRLALSWEGGGERGLLLFRRH